MGLVFTPLSSSKKPKKTVKRTPKTLTPPASCHFCKIRFKNPRDADDAFCYGCKHHICEGCERNFCLMGSHDISEHLENPEEETFHDD